VARRKKKKKGGWKGREPPTDPRPESAGLPPRSEPQPQGRPVTSDPEAETLAIGGREPATEYGPTAPSSSRSLPPPAPAPAVNMPRPPQPASPPQSGRAKPPTIGRVSQSWRRQLAETGWPRPSYAADSGEIGPLIIRAASVVGQGHLHRGIQRQDAYHFAPAGAGAVVAIADGVSQMPLSALGAEVAAFSAVRDYAVSCRATASASRAERPGPAELVADATEAADAEVERLAGELSIAPRELSTTLLMAALEPGPSGEVQVTIGAVGNSSAFEMISEESPAILSGPGSEDSSAAYREFLPGAGGSARIDRARLRPGATLLLATDGLAEDLVSSASVRRWLWERLTSTAMPLELAYALTYRRQGSMDDLTALAVQRS
jgi:serine/threonine protein phosphatase PrpC